MVSETHLNTHTHTEADQAGGARRDRWVLADPAATGCIGNVGALCPGTLRKSCCQDKEREREMERNGRGRLSEGKAWSHESPQTDTLTVHTLIPSALRQSQRARGSELDLCYSNGFGSGHILDI